MMSEKPLEMQKKVLAKELLFLGQREIFAKPGHLLFAVRDISW